MKSKLVVLVPSQVRALRMKSNMPRQKDLAVAAHLHQSRISMFETPGMANITLETLAKLAAAFKVGVIVKFVPLSHMLRWENEFSQDDFKVDKLDEDEAFLDPASVVTEGLAAVNEGSGNDLNDVKKPVETEHGFRQSSWESQKLNNQKGSMGALNG